MDRAERIAEKLATDWDSRAAYETLSGELAPADIAEAYRAQALLHEKLASRRGPIAGRKIALSSKAMQQMVGLSQPVAGVFFERDIMRSPAAVSFSNFRGLGLEFELALEIGQDVPPQDRPHDRESVRALVAGVRPAFELIEDKGADYAVLDAFTLVADNAWCGGVVLGDPVPNWQARDLDALAGTIHQPGHEPERTVTGAAAPLTSLAWVLNHASAAGRTVRRGEHVITGSAARTRFPKPGDQVRYELDGLAAAEVEVV
jgi:2-keto-4-pentenoate hydratase